MKQSTKNNFLVLIILINPIIDLLAGIGQNALNLNISIAAVVRSVILCVITLHFFCHIIVHRTWLRQKYTLLYIFLSLIYASVFLIIRFTEFNGQAFFQQGMFFIRYISFPIYIICLRLFISSDNIDLVKNTLVNTLFIYSILIVVPYVTNTGFNAYAMEGLEGTVGWFVGANEIGGLIGLLSSTYLLDIAHRKLSRLDFAKIPLPLAALLIVGTKAAFLFALLYISVLAIVMFNKSRFRFKKSIFSILGVSTIVVLINSPAVNNIFFIFSKMNPSKLVAALLSGRLTFLNQTRVAYYGSSILNKLFGIGFFSYHNDSILKVDKLIEMDFHDILFRTGLIGAVLIYLPMIVLCVSIVRSMIRNSHLRKESLFIGFFILVTIFSGLLIGHVFSAPSVSFFVALLLLVLFEVNNKGEVVS